jgi:hypothetical protein
MGNDFAKKFHTFQFALHSNTPKQKIQVATKTANYSILCLTRQNGKAVFVKTTQKPQSEAVFAAILAGNLSHCLKTAQRRDCAFRIRLMTRCVRGRTHLGTSAGKFEKKSLFSRFSRVGLKQNAHSIALYTHVGKIFSKTLRSCICGLIGC